MTKHPSIAPDTFFHVFNRGNNREDIFREERNYDFFLSRYRKHVSPIADTFAYCLLRNHFHLLLRIKPIENWPDARTPERRFGDFLNSYAKAFNKAYDRTGSLFQKRFGRIEITTQEQLETVVRYIHRNPETHGFVDDFRLYPYSSYRRLISSEPTALRRNEVLTWFDSREGFIEAHLSGDDDATTYQVSENW